MLQENPAERVFDEVYVAAHPYVKRYVMRRVQGDVDEIVDEVFLTAWRRRDKMPVVDDELLMWLYGIARRVTANKVRWHRRRERFHKSIEPLTSSSSSDENSSIDSMTVHAALARLKPADREILMLVEWEGLTIRQSAEVLKVTESAAGKRLAAARESFRRCCGDLAVA